MKVTLYTNSDCGPCMAMKIALRRNQIEFEEIPVDSDPKITDMLWNMGHRALPVLLLDTGENWSGYRPSEVKELALRIKQR